MSRIRTTEFQYREEAQEAAYDVTSGTGSRPRRPTGVHGVGSPGKATK